MPVPTELLRAAWAVLPEATLRRAAEHNGIRGWAKLSVGELVEGLAANEISLPSYSRQLSPSEAVAVATIFGLEVAAVTPAQAREAIWRHVVEYDRNAQRAEARKQAHTLPLMTAAELIAAAVPLRRRVLHLVPEPGEPIAIWSGDRFSRKGGQHPWLAVDLSRHPDDALRRAGVLRLAVDTGKLTATVEFDTGLLPSSRKGEVALSGITAEELPQPDILFQEGPSRVRDWVAEVAARGHDIKDGFGSPAFPLQDELDGYARAYQAALPLYAGPPDEERVYAQLGGWPINWPEATGVEQLGRRLVLRTYRSSEPYVEVWTEGDGYAVELRIT